MANYCPNCGNKTSGGICSNCQEELYIFTYQYDDMEGEISDSFAEKIKEQKEQLRRQNEID